MAAFADGGYQGPKFNQALARVLPHLKAEIIKLPIICGVAQTLDRRANFRLAQSVPQACQGPGEPQSKNDRILVSRLNPSYAQKDL